MGASVSLSYNEHLAQLSKAFTAQQCQPCNLCQFNVGPNKELLSQFQRQEGGTTEGGDD